MLGKEHGATSLINGKGDVCNAEGLVGTSGSERKKVSGACIVVHKQAMSVRGNGQRKRWVGSSNQRCML